MALCRLLEILITPECKMMESLFIFAMVWAVGSGLCEKDGIEYKKNFSQWWKNTFKGIKFPAQKSIFDYYVD